MNRRDMLAALALLPATATIARAKVQPTDVIVIEAPGPLAPADVEKITKALHSVWPDNRCIVLTNGLKMRIAEHAAGDAGAVRF